MGQGQGASGKVWVGLGTLASVGALLVLGASSARAAIVFDGSPGTAAPPPTLGPYTMTPYTDDPRPDGSDVTETEGFPGGSELGFSDTMSLREVGTSWATWSHGYMGDVYFAGFNNTDVAMTMPPDTGAIYFYVGTGGSGAFLVAATADDGTTSGPVFVGVGKYFGFYGTDGDEVVAIQVVFPDPPFGFAVGEFGWAPEGREGTFSCRAQALRFGNQPGQYSKVANPPTHPCADDEKPQSSFSGTLGGLTVTASNLDALTNLVPDDQFLPPQPGDRGEGEASIEKLVIKGSRKVVLRGITGYAAARCRLDGQGNFGPTLVSSSAVGSVQQGSRTPVPIGDQNLSIPLGSLGVLRLNPDPQISVNENRSVIVQRAVWLERPPGQQDVIAAEAQADYHGDPCSSGAQSD